MNSKKFIVPEIEIVVLNTEDVIATSPLDEPQKPGFELPDDVFE